MSKPRVLIDTNVLISGLVWNGNESCLLEMSISRDIHLLIPAIVLTEARRVLDDKFPNHSGLLDDVLSLLDCEVLARPSHLALESAAAVLRDPNDAEILAAIIDSKPNYAVTGDKDLLTPNVRELFPTSRSADFLRCFLDADSES